MSLQYKPVWRVQARGDGEFPIDMLRYDACYPELEMDSAAITASGPRVVSLLSHARQLSPDRWQSFGWNIQAVRA